MSGLESMSQGIITHNRRILKYGLITGCFLLGLLLSYFIFPPLFKAARERNEAKLRAEQEHREANDPVMRQRTIEVWNEILKVEHELSKQTGSASQILSEGAFSYSQINIEHADPNIVWYVTNMVEACKRFSTICSSVEAEQQAIGEAGKKLENWLTIAGTVIGALANNNQSVQDNIAVGEVAGTVAGKATSFFTGQMDNEELRKKYGPKLSQCRADLKALEAERVRIADTLSKKYGVPFQNPF